jgi:hypothetical protein
MVCKDNCDQIYFGKCLPSHCFLCNKALNKFLGESEKYVRILNFIQLFMYDIVNLKQTCDMKSKVRILKHKPLPNDGIAAEKNMQNMFC